MSDKKSQDTKGGNLIPLTLDPPAKETPPKDIFDDLDRLSGGVDFAMDGVEAVLTRLPVRKPDKMWWVRVHPEARTTVGLVEIDREETYCVASELHSDLMGVMKRRTLYLAIARTGNPFLWPVGVEGPDGKLDEWNRSARDGAELGMKSWVRLQANMPNGAYDVFAAKPVVPIPEPRWPTESINELLRLAFRDRVIDSPDHPVVRQLQGLE
jgi:hypothetical protein